MFKAFSNLVNDVGVNKKHNFLNKLIKETDNEELIIKTFESECSDSLYTYKVIPGRLTKDSKVLSSFIVVKENEYQYIKYINGIYYSQDGSINISDYDGCRYLYIREVVNICSPKEIMNEIVNFTPVWSLLFLMLTPFALVTPIYTNIFNTRLIYSNNISTLLIVSVMFFLAYICEFYSKRFIKNKCLKLNAESSLIFERYMLKMTPYYKGFSSVHSVKTIEQYRKMIWDFIPTIASDILTFIILFITLSVFISWFSIYFLIFYLVVFSVFYIFRSKLYKHLIDLESASNDVLKLRVSNTVSKLNIPFINRNLLFSNYLLTYSNSQYYEDKIANFNFYWDELTKLVSFLALFLLFLISFFGISSSDINPAYMIVLFIIGSRLSSSIVQIVTRLSYLKAGMLHINQSLENLITEDIIALNKIDDLGLSLDDVNKIKLTNITIKHDDKILLKGVNVKFHKDLIYGVKGPVGSGKSSLLKTIIGLNKDYRGKIEFDGVDLNNIDPSFFESRVSYLNSSENQFFSGSLEDNFVYRNCNSKKMMDTILKECFGKRVFDYQTMYVDDIDSIAMSTGQRRKLLFMLSLLDRSKVYVFDEVLVNLSKDDIIRCLLLMKEYVRDSIIILASHNDSILNTCDAIYEINGFNVEIVK
ncbi:TPA: ATP-binding cassette domain-containing protein [Vibrio vulnificus]|nr:ATP-binding cassette domain-containing protein [Vibrio vulnificus]